MATAEVSTIHIGPHSNGSQLTPWEFDGADFEPGYRYELVNGVVIASPPPNRGERDPNGELEHWLRHYQANHPQGSSLDLTLSEETVHVGPHRRRVDRAIWAGLGRLPHKNETPTIAIEFVSIGRRSVERDYKIKRDEYCAAGVAEYWVIDRFALTVTVHCFSASKSTTTVYTQQQTIETPLLPGFKLSLAKLFEIANRWED